MLCNARKRTQDTYREREGACPGVSGFAPWAPSRVDMCALQIFCSIIIIAQPTCCYYRNQTFWFMSYKSILSIAINLCYGMPYTCVQKCPLCLWNKVRGSKIDNPIILYAIPLILVSYEREFHEQQSFHWIYLSPTHSSWWKMSLEKVPVNGCILLCNNVWIHAWLGREFGNQWDILLKQIGMKGLSSFTLIPTAVN